MRRLSHGNLATDGASLFWQDVRAIRKISVNGGAITTLDQTRENTPTAGIVLQNGRIIYASVTDIRFVPITGAVTTPAVRTIATAATTVTALHAGLSGVNWGDRDGAVRVKRSGSPAHTLPGTAGLMATSIATNGVVTANGVQSDAQIAWTRCTSQVVSTGAVSYLLRSSPANRPRRPRRSHHLRRQRILGRYGGRAPKTLQ